MKERSIRPSVAGVLALALAFGPAAAAACALLCGEVGNGESDSASVHSGHSGHAGHAGHGEPSAPGDDRAAAPRSGRASVGVESAIGGCCDHPGIREARDSAAVAAESLTADYRAAKSSLPTAPVPPARALRVRNGGPTPGSVPAAWPALSRTVVLRL